MEFWETTHPTWGTSRTSTCVIFRNKQYLFFGKRWWLTYSQGGASACLDTPWCASAFDLPASGDILWIVKSGNEGMESRLISCFTISRLQTWWTASCGIEEMYCSLPLSNTCKVYEGCQWTPDLEAGKSYKNSASKARGKPPEGIRS